MSDAKDFLASLAGRRITGGCEHCDAYQIVEQTEGAWLWALTVYHDDDCPMVNR